MGRLLEFRKRDGGAWPGGTPSDAYPDSVFPSDARPADDPPPGKAPDPEAERRRRFQRGAVMLVLGTIFVAGSSATVVGNRGYLDLRRSRDELATLEREVERKQEEVMGLKKELDRLKRDPLAIERLAREELGFVKPGEISFLLPPPDEDGTRRGKILLPPLAVRRTPGKPVDASHD